MFTAAAILRLVESTTIDLGAGIGQYLSGLPQAWQSFTIHQLLTHTTGMILSISANAVGLFKSSKNQRIEPDISGRIRLTLVPTQNMFGSDDDQKPFGCQCHHSRLLAHVTQPLIRRALNRSGNGGGYFFKKGDQGVRRLFILTDTSKEIVDAEQS